MFQNTEMLFHKTEEEFVNLQPFQPKLIVPKYIKQYYPWILENLRWVHKIIILSLYFCYVFYPFWSEYKEASELQMRNTKLLKRSCPASEAPHSCSPALSCPSGASKKTYGSRSRQFDKWSNDEEERKNKTTTTKKNTPLKNNHKPTNQQINKKDAKAIPQHLSQANWCPVCLCEWVPFQNPLPLSFYCCIRC